MKATGIIRRVDDLGRVVIPKEIRRTLHINDGDPLELFVIDGGVCYKKHVPYGQLNYMAAIAQGESESKSESVKWGFRKRFAMGLPKIADLYGFERSGRSLSVYEPEAAVVRLIFQMFCDGRTIPEICDILNMQSIPSPRGLRWAYSTVKTILINEKYCGDVLMQKTVTVDIFTHRSVPNDGRATKYIVRDHHPAVIPREQWVYVQSLFDTESDIPVPNIDEVADLSERDLPDILDNFFRDQRKEPLK